jgi:methionine synthase II (cobalamin-independent)
MTTGIGSMPNTDAGEACAMIEKYFSLPFWPQLPERSSLENMYMQYSEGFPGIRVNNGVLTVDRSGNFDSELEKFYNDYGENKYSDLAISADYAAALYRFLDIAKNHTSMVKGQVTGPISWGLSVTDEQGRGILYDELMAETIAKFLKLKAMWQENMLKTVSKTTILFIDEPYLASLGSAFVAISNQQVKALLEEVLSGIDGIRGIHCCGSTDWSLLLDNSTDILSFDTYSYADSLTTYVKNVNSFIRRGGTIAWGIVPNEEYGLAQESLSSLYDRLGEAMSPYTYDGISFKQLVEQSIITPSCSLASLPVEAAVRVMELIGELSNKIKTKYL